MSEQKLDKTKPAKTKPAKTKPAKTKPAKTKPAKTEKITRSNGGQIVIDGSNLIAGRVSSNVAKLLRKGNRVTIVNCDKIMISGKKASIVGEYREFLKIASILHPKHGPFHPRRPDTIMKRMIRGMLPKEKPSKKTDLERLRTYIGIPRQLKTLERTQLENSRITKPSPSYTTMAELSRYIGGTDF